MSSVMRFDEWQDSNGSAVAFGAGGKFRAPGTVLQVVNTSKTDTFSSASTSFTQVTGMAATITPFFATSSIVVLGQFVVSNGDNSNRVGAWKITRGGDRFLCW